MKEGKSPSLPQGLVGGTDGAKGNAPPGSRGKAQPAAVAGGHGHKLYAWPVAANMPARRPKVIVRPQARPVNRFG
ncbi:hypothetical protein CE91St32_02250 [Gordonibacter pamelaeae]|nr:hypothetical protein CE91St32_02250 [Gordonibacter pamelaeae]